MHCRVHWRNPNTGEMEFCVAKSLDMAKASSHDGGWAGWHADALHEVEALRCLAGVPGVPALRDVIIEPDGAIHIVMEYVLLPHQALGM
jgi:hypothetical protein